MPLNPADKARRKKLVEAAQVLRDNQRDDLAESVDYVLTSKGLAFVRRVREAEGGNPNLSVRIPGNRWAELAPYEDDGEFVAIIERGFQSFVHGTFDARVQRTPRGSAAGAHMLNVSPSGALQAQVAVQCRDEREHATSGPALHVSTIAALSLYQHYGIGPYDDNATTREKVQVHLNAALMDAVNDSGLPTKELATIVESGLRLFVAGSFDLRLPDRSVPQKGKGGPISLFLDAGLVQQTRGRFSKVKTEQGLPGYAAYTSVAAAVLAERFRVGQYASGAGA